MSIEIYKDLKERLAIEPKLIGFIGPIGAGKSTIARSLGEILGIPVNEEKFPESPFLEKFYKSPKEWSLKSQTWFLLEKIKQLKELDFTKSQIIDPSIEMDYKIFAPTLHKIGFMNSDELKLYNGIVELEYLPLLDKGIIKKPDLIVVVNAPPEVLIRRIQERGRPFELIMLRNYPSYISNLRRSVEIFANSNECVYVDSSKGNFTDKRHLKQLIGKIEDKI